MKIDQLSNQQVTRYAELKRQENAIKAELKEVTPEVTTWLQEVIDPNGKDKTIELPNGDKLTLVQGKDWQYTAYIQDKLKELKAEATKVQKRWQIENPDGWEDGAISVRFKEGGEK